MTEQEQFIETSENYYSEPVQCDGCGVFDDKLITDTHHVYPEHWIQLSIVGQGDIIGKHYCNNCAKTLIDALP